jgi:hypothetical protein
VAAVTGWETGLGALDRLSGIGGLPRGRLTVLTGHGTCGKLSLGLEALARASRELAVTAVLDLGRVFDAWALSSHGADLERVVVVRPPDAGACGEAALALARAGCGLLLMLLPGRRLAGCEPWLPALEGAAARSGTVVVAVAEAGAPALAHSSSLTLGCERRSWVLEAGRPAGLRALVTCLKNRVGAPGGTVEVEVRYPLGVEPLAAGAAVREVASGAVVREAVSAAEGEVAWRSAAV